MKGQHRRRSRRRGLHRRRRSSGWSGQLKPGSLVALAAGLTATWLPAALFGANVHAAAVSAVGMKTIEVDGQTAFNVPGLVAEGTTYMPIWYIQTVLRRLGISNTWNGREWDIANVGAPRSVWYRPPYGSSTRAIVWNGQTAYLAPSIVYQGTTYMPIWYIQQVLKRTGDSSTWLNSVWDILLGQGQHYQYQTAVGSAGIKTVSLNGKSVFEVTGIVHNGTTYMPLSTLESALNDIGLLNTVSGNAQWDIASSGAPQATGATPRAGNYAVVANGGAPTMVSSFFYGGQTYLSLYSVQLILRSLGVANTWDGWTWQITAPPATSRTNTAPTVGTPGVSSNTKAGPALLGFVTDFGGSSASLNDTAAHQSQVSQVATFDHTVLASGSLAGTANAAILAYAATQHMPAFATVVSQPEAGQKIPAMDTVLQSSSATAALQKNIVQIVETNGYSGAALDIEQLSASDRQLYSAFVTNLAAQLHAVGKELYVALPADTSATAEAWNAAYDYAEIGAAADRVILMAYDYSYPGGPAGPIAPVPWVSKVLAYTTSQIPADKVLLGIDAYGYEWTGRQTQALSLPAVNALIAADHITPRWDATDEAPYFTYTDTNHVTHTVYYEDGKSTSAKLALAKQAGIAGIAIWHMGLEDTSLWDAVSAYLQSSPAPSQSSS